MCRTDSQAILTLTIQNGAILSDHHHFSLANISLTINLGKHYMGIQAFGLLDEFD